MKLLRRYEEKRDFEKTSEPGTEVGGRSPGTALSFVVQKHAASHLHYDFRLEVGGVLKSWAVPKGLPKKNGERRLAVEVEDHPLGYAGFEGNIPKGQYGGGSVIVWDRGTFMPEGATSALDGERLAAEGLTNGKLKFHLDGTKLNGEFTLVRTEKENQWLLIGREDAPGWDERSAISGRTIEEVRDGLQPLPSKIAAATTAALDFLAPMVPEEYPKAFDDPDWTFELKIDGIRAIALREGETVRLLTRQGNDVTEKFPGVVRDLLQLSDPSFAVDGEIVVLDTDGRPSFHALMERFNRTGAGAVNPKAQFWIFDLLRAQGKDLRRQPLRDRRKALEALQPSSKALRVLDTYPESGKVLYEQAIALKFEGIVAKRLDSPYRDGQRSDDWRKIKRYHTEEFLIAGYTRGIGGREHTFGALILARQTESGLEFCGSVGGGFSEVRLEELKTLLDKEPEIRNPFSGPIETKGEPRFVSPKHLVEVRFMAWTAEGRLRMPQFVRLRPDLKGVHFAPVEEFDEVEKILEALETDKHEAEIRADGHDLKLTSLDKILWPARKDEPAFTKRDLLAYYARISRVMLPHLKDRPLAIVRHPEGIDAPGFFQKHVGEAPSFVERVEIWSSTNKGTREWMLCNNLAALMWLGQMSAVEIHPWYSRISVEPDAHAWGVDFVTEDGLDESVLSFPDFVVFDLDPSFPDRPAEEWWEPTVQVGKALRKILSGLGLRSYPKSSGKAGLHVYVPLRRDHDYAELRALAEGIGQHLVADRALGVTMEWNLSKRPPGIFLDYKQNVRGKTLASAYSPRPVPGAPVSMPLKWDELDIIRPADFHIQNAPSFVADRGDAWADLLGDCQKLWFNPE